jgi:beta-lactamase regulating signal transducer with metallopeptidase domain
MIDTLAASVTVRAIGWALLQSLWQGALIGAVTAAALLVLRRGAPNRRYVVACAGLIAIAVVSVVTAVAYARELQTTSIHQDLAEPLAFSSTTADARGSAVVSDPMAHGDTSRPPATSSAGRWWSRQRLEAWSVIAVPLWLVGVLLLSSRLVVSWFIIEKIRRAATRPVPEDWRTRAHSLAASLRVTRPLRIVESAVVSVPMVIGWLRPVILLPGAALTGLSPSQLEAIIAHELAHIRRYDYLVNVCQTTIETLLFYHPASWWISRQIRVEREHCCDDVAVDLCGDRLTYARALADLEEFRSADVAFALAATGGPLIHRIRRLLGLSSREEGRSATWMVVSVVLVVLSLALMGEGVKGAGRPPLAVSEREAEALPTTQTSSSGESAVRGRVVDARSGAPIANATVELSGNGREATAVTDADGRYEVRGLEPGEYHVFAEAARYVPAQYGQRDPGEVGTSLDIRVGQTISGVDVRLQPAGVISGRIFADSGDGLPGVEIQLLARRYRPGGPAPAPVAFAQTEALGAFRVGELQPGEYYVRAYVPPTVRPTHAAGAQVYGSTYFPSATRIEEAQPILVGDGQEVLDVDFTLATITPRVVTGTLIDPTEPRFDHAQVIVSPLGGSTFNEQTAPVSSDGHFQIRNVLPGDYMLHVQDPGFWQDSAKFARWFAATRVITVVDDLSGVELVARRGAHVDGRIVRNGGEAFPFDPHTIRVGVAQWMESRPGMADFQHQIGAVFPGVQADGTFAIESPGGSSSLQVENLPQNWTVKAIRLEGSDITDRPIDFGDGVRRRLEIVLTDHVANVRGVVTDRNGRVVANYTLVVFPEDKDHWRPPTRFVRGVRPLQDGSFRIDTLPPADYLAIAVEGLPQEAWSDPTVLDRLYPLATRFRLSEGEQRTLQLKLSPTPEGLLAQRDLRNAVKSLSTRRR